MDESKPLRLLIYPGRATSDELAQVLIAINDLYVAIGGDRLIWSVEGVGADSSEFIATPETADDNKVKALALLLGNIMGDSEHGEKEDHQEANDQEEHQEESSGKGPQGTDTRA